MLFIFFLFFFNMRESVYPHQVILPRILRNILIKIIDVVIWVSTRDIPSDFRKGLLPQASWWFSEAHKPGTHLPTSPTKHGCGGYIVCVCLYLWGQVARACTGDMYQTAHTGSLIAGHTYIKTSMCNSHWTWSFSCTAQLHWCGWSGIFQSLLCRRSSLPSGIPRVRTKFCFLHLNNIPFSKTSGICSLTMALQLCQVLFLYGFASELALKETKSYLMHEQIEEVQTLWLWDFHSNFAGFYPSHNSSVMPLRRAKAGVYITDRLSGTITGHLLPHPASLQRGIWYPSWLSPGARVQPTLWCFWYEE